MAIFRDNPTELLRKSVSLLEQLVKSADEARSERLAILKGVGGTHLDPAKMREESEQRLQKIREEAEQRHQEEQQFRQQLLAALQEQTQLLARLLEKLSNSSSRGI